jgi:hypothetical protein
MKSRSSCCQLDSWLYLVQARAAVAVTIEQRRQMLGADEYAMAVPGPAGSVEVEMDGPCGGLLGIHAGHCFRAGGGLLERRVSWGHDNLL